MATESSKDVITKLADRRKSRKIQRESSEASEVSFASGGGSEVEFNPPRRPSVRVNEVQDAILEDMREHFETIEEKIDQLGKYILNTTNTRFQELQREISLSHTQSIKRRRERTNSGINLRVRRSPLPPLLSNDAASSAADFPSVTLRTISGLDPLQTQPPHQTADEDMSDENMKPWKHDFLQTSGDAEPELLGDVQAPDEQDEDEEQTNSPKPKKRTSVRLNTVQSLASFTLPELAEKRKNISRNSNDSDNFYMYLSPLLRTRKRSPFEKALWQFLDDPDLVKGGRTCMNLFSMVICFSAIMPLLQSLEQPPMDVTTAAIVAMCLDSLLALETVIRLLVCPNRIRFFFNIYNWIDIIAAFVPFSMRAAMLNASTLSDTASIESLVLFSVGPTLRLLKLLRRFETFFLLTHALAKSAEALPMLLFTLVLIVIMFASVLFALEPRENVETIGHALWFAIVTVSTVGYGDITPQSTGGIVASSALIVISSLYMAIPLAIVGEAFSQVWKDRERLLLVHRIQVRFLNTGYRAEDIPPMFCGWDDDGDGQITLPEFIHMMRLMELDISGPRLVQLFNAFDTDGSGTIDDQEFVRHLFPEEYTELYATVEPSSPAGAAGGVEMRV